MMEKYNFDAKITRAIDDMQQEVMSPFIYDL